MCHHRGNSAAWLRIALFASSVYLLAFPVMQVSSFGLLRPTLATFGLLLFAGAQHCPCFTWELSRISVLNRQSILACSINAIFPVNTVMHCIAFAVVRKEKDCLHLSCVLPLRSSVFFTLLSSPYHHGLWELLGTNIGRRTEENLKQILHWASAAADFISSTGAAEGPYNSTKGQRD